MILLRLQVPLINELLMILTLAIIFILILRRFRLPSVIGFLVAGALSGSNGLNFHDFIYYLPEWLSTPLYSFVPAYINPPEEEVEILAEVGVALLLFTIGLEFSVASLVRLRREVFIGGGLQVLLTIVAFAGISYWVSYDYWPIALFIGFLFALSSTAIVLKLLQESGDINRPHGQAILSILIFQDLIVVPMMLITPMMATGDLSSLGGEVLILSLKVVGLLLAVFVLAKYIMPFLLKQVARAKSKDLFIVSMLTLCFVIAYITSLVGLSFALGAFIAGLIIAESKYSHQAVASIMYFKELFTSIFFISVGLMLNITFLTENWLVILPLTLMVIVVKAVIGALAASILRYPPRSVFGVALGISQIGEFSFILSKLGEDVGLMPIEIYQYFLAVAVFTMIISPILIHYTDPLFQLLTHGWFVPGFVKKYFSAVPKNAKAFNVESHSLKEHILIIGHNLTSRTLAHGAKTLNIPYVVIELDPDIVERESKKGEPIIYGDASSEEVLDHAGIAEASLVVIASASPDEAMTVLHAIKDHNPEIHVIVRTEGVLDAEVLSKQGADTVISDEVESNIEMLIEVMDYLDFPTPDTYKFINYIKADSLANQGKTISLNGEASEEYEEKTKKPRWLTIFK